MGLAGSFIVHHEVDDAAAPGTKKTVELYFCPVQGLMDHLAAAEHFVFR